MEKERNLLGEGGTGVTFELSSPSGDRMVAKKFCPKKPLEILYRLFYHTSHHPYSPESPLFPLALQAALQRRHIASLVSKVSSSSIEVLDAEPSNTGLQMPFVEGRPLTHNDQGVLAELDELTQFFQEMGLPSWNLRGVLGWTGWKPLKFLKRGFNNILITPEGNGVAVDNEEGIPVPDRQWCGLRFDDICHPTLRQGLKQKRGEITQRIGEESFRKLETATQIESLAWGSFRDWEKSPLYTAQTVIRALKPIYLLETVNWLLEIGRISSQEASSLREEIINLPDLKQQLKKVAPHLVVHNLTRLLPHGFSSAARLTYTLGAKLIEQARKHEPKKHTWIVAIASLIPTTGGFAYLIDLIPTQNPKMTKLALESIAHHGFHTWLDHLIEIYGKRNSSRKMVVKLEKLSNRAAFLKKALGTALEEQFGKEIVEEVTTNFIQAAKSEPRVTDDYPTQLFVGDKVFFIAWGNREVIELDLSTKEVKQCPPQRTEEIIGILRNESIALCQELEEILTAA